MELLAVRPHRNLRDLAKAMDPRDDPICPTQAAHYSELSRALGEGKIYLDTPGLAKQARIHTSTEVQGYVDLGIRNSSKEGVCVSPTSVFSNQHDNGHCRS